MWVFIAHILIIFPAICLRLQERIKEAKKSKVVNVDDFDRWIKAVKEY